MFKIKKEIVIILSVFALFFITSCQQPIAGLPENLPEFSIYCEDYNRIINPQEAEAYCSQDTNCKWEDGTCIDSSPEALQEVQLPQVEDAKLPEQNSLQLTENQEAVKEVIGFAKISSLSLNDTNQTTNATNITTTTQYSPCSLVSDGICPSVCSAGSDYDCCTNAGKCLYNGVCNYCNQNATICSITKDNICPSGCLAGSDYDCCINKGWCWYPSNNGCQVCNGGSSSTTSTTLPTSSRTTTTITPQSTTTTVISSTTTTIYQSPCLTTSDGICPGTCAAGSDYDCCQNAGKCWREGQGCYDTC